MRWPKLRSVKDRLELQRLRESEARYRMLAESAGDVVIQYDLSGVIRYASPSVASLGYRPEDLVGRQSGDFFPPDEAAARQARLERLRAGGTLPRGAENERRLRHGDGHWVWVQGNPTILRDPHGQAQGVVTILRDVTERVALEAELRSKRAEAEAAVVAKAEFLANMSHEIRTPLTAVVGFAELLAKIDGLPERARVYAERIGRSGDALTSIVNNVLDFSRVEAGQVELNCAPFEVRTLLEEAVSVVLETAHAKGLKLTVEVGPDLPETFVGDPGRLRQVLLNLLTNAVKFTSAGTVTVRAGSGVGSEHLRIEVADTGIGVPSDQRGRLFQRFSQVESSNARRFGGVGLGLAISKGLVELMGGEIGVESAAGQGSTFWFTVAAPEDTAAPSKAADAEVVALPRARVLVVDDARANRELILSLLSPFDLHVTEAIDGGQAVEAAQRSPYDVILMDLQMPGMDGMAAARAIRQRCPLNRGTPILAVSASVLPSDVEACRAAGMNDHVPKPINPRELLGKIAHWALDPGPPAPLHASGC